ncbi:Heat shock protein ssb1 [Tritrichomonas musculus]|uniref:Heat shock protein ssb1 n=1 Tax=Tritrichomonas musculus TaxID=1915356 RepID=A0ABR2KJY8_9EUKA
MNAKVSIGLDLGTTFSSIYIFEDGRPEPKEYDCHRFIPTKVSYYYDIINEKDHWNYGFEAEREMDRTILIDIKRMLGISANIPNLHKLIEEWRKLGIIITESHEENVFPKGKIRIQIKRTNNNTFYMSPEEIAGDFIKYMVEKIAEINITPELKIVITIPANYSSNQRRATLKSAMHAGFTKDNIKLLHEPSAAALSYMMLRPQQSFLYNNFLVCDFGGGTFDLSLLKISNSVFDVKRIGGNRYLGGRDFDDIIYKWICHLYESKNIIIDDKYSKINLIKCQQVKIELSKNGSAPITFEGTNERLQLEQKDFESRCNLPIWINNEQKPSLLDQCIISINELLSNENISKEQIDAVILVGGTSLLPIFTKRMDTFFGKEKILKFTKGREAIALGACYLAAINNGEKESPFNNVNFNQRLAHSLGIELAEDRFQCVIKRNTPIPCPIHTSYLQTYRDFQTVVVFNIYECDEDFVHNGELVYQFRFVDLPSKKEGEVKFTFKMLIDQNGIAKITCTCPQKNETLTHEFDMEFQAIENLKNILNDDFNTHQGDPKDIKDCQNNKNARNQAKDILLR